MFKIEPLQYIESFAKKSKGENMLPAATFSQILRDLDDKKSIFFECDKSQVPHCWSYNGAKIDSIVDLINKIKGAATNLILSETDFFNESEQVAGKLIKKKIITYIEPADSVANYDPETLKVIADNIIRSPYSRKVISRTVFKVEVDKAGESANECGGVTVFPHTEESIKEYSQAVPVIVETMRNYVAQKLQTPIKISELIEKIGQNHFRIFGFIF